MGVNVKVYVAKPP